MNGENKFESIQHTMWFEYLIGCYSEREFATRDWLEAQENWLPYEVPSNNSIVECAYSLWLGLNTAASLAARKLIKSWWWPSLQTLRTSVEFLSSFQLPFALLGLRSWLFLLPIFVRRPCRVPPGPQNIDGKISGKLAARPLQSDSEVTEHSFLAFLLSTSAFEGHRLRF